MRSAGILDARRQQRARLLCVRRSFGLVTPRTPWNNSTSALGDSVSDCNCSRQENINLLIDERANACRGWQEAGPSHAFAVYREGVAHPEARTMRNFS